MAIELNPTCTKIWAENHDPLANGASASGFCHVPRKTVETLDGRTEVYICGGRFVQGRTISAAGAAFFAGRCFDQSGLPFTTEVEQPPVSPGDTASNSGQ